MKVHKTSFKYTVRPDSLIRSKKAKGAELDEQGLTKVTGGDGTLKQVKLDTPLGRK